MAVTVAGTAPLPPPVLNLPFGRVENGMVFLSLSGIEFLQKLWVSIQGSGGLIDQNAATAAPPGLGVGMALALIERAAAGISLQAPRPSPDTARQRDVQDAGLLASRSAPRLPIPLDVTYGGTGLSSVPANGAIDIGNGAGFTRTTLTAGANVSITNTPGGIAIAATTAGGSYAVVTTGSSYTETVTTGEKIVLMTATGQSITLPTAVGNTAKFTAKLLVAGTLTVTAAGAEKIDGSGNAVVAVQYGFITIVSDGANWFIVAK